MNLSDLTNYVCTKSQLVETDDQAAAALFLSKRYELIYNAYLWKDSLGITEISFNALTNLDNLEGIIYLPREVDRVVGLRTCQQSVRVIGLEDSFRVDYDRFNKWAMYGSPTEFSILSPDWFEVRPNTTGGFAIGGVVMNIGVPGYNVVVFQGLIAGQTYIMTVGSQVQGVYQGTYDANATGNNFLDNAVTIPPPYNVPIIFVATGNCAAIQCEPFAFPPTNALYGFTHSSPTQSIGVGATVTITSDNETDINGTPGAIQVKVTWRDKTDRYTTTSGLPLTLTPVDGRGQIEIESVFKPVTVGNLTATVNNPYMGVTFSNLAGSIPPACLRSPSYQRIRIFPKPSQPIFLSVLFKKPFTPLTFPSEEPAIRNLDNCLIAYAMGDMLERSRQYGKAQGQYQEAAGLLAELAKLETIQAANNTRFIPDNGYGDPFFAPSSNRGLWF